MGSGGLAAITQGALICLLPLLGIGVIVGLLRPGKAIRLIAALAMSVCLLPLLVALIPLWLLILALPLAAYWIFNGAAGLLLGRGVADHVVGSLVTDVIRAALALPFRVIGGMFRRLCGGW